MKLSFDNTEIAFAHKSNAELKKAYWLFKLVGSPALVKFGKVSVGLALKLRIPIGWAMRNNIFAQFCGGESIADCAQTTQVLDKGNVGTILDYSVEGKESSEDFERTTQEILRTVETANDNIHIPFCVFKTTGISRFSLLEKVNANAELSPEEQAEFEGVKTRMDRIAKSAFETGTPVFIDAEESWIQDAIDDMAHELMAKYNKERVIVYNTVQLYRHDRLAFLQDAIAEAKSKGYHYGVKLVRGAYMEKERDRAEEHGYQDPIQPNKEASDKDFDAAIKLCIDKIEYVAVVAGSHNEASSKALAELMIERNIAKNDKRVYFAQLFGMSDHISFNLSHAGYNVAKYVPYGPIREVIPYLIRRAEENTSVKGQTGRELSLIQREIQRRKGRR
ncbi:MAG: proline dehydrogenase family protein [Flavobacteriales bacterium]|nr:proline dehydrogenase family protein [Flavobacteriales bacterium]